MGKFTGFVAGAAIGAAAALLLAPKAGKELRADLKEVVDNALEGNEWFDFDIEYTDQPLEDINTQEMTDDEDIVINIPNSEA